MILEKQTLKTLIDKYIGDDLAGYIYNQQMLVNNIVRQRQLLQDEQFKLNEEYHQDSNTIKQKLKDLQLTCPHLEYSYHGDPAGGSDSFNECRQCGEQW